LTTDQQYQQRLLKTHEIFSIQVRKIISAALKAFFLRRWRRFWLIRSFEHSEHHILIEYFFVWRKIIHATMTMQSLADQKRLMGTSVICYSASSTSLCKSKVVLSIQESALTFNRIVEFIQVFDGMFHRWKVYSRNQFLRRNKMLGMNSCMLLLEKYFIFRGCCIDRNKSTAVEMASKYLDTKNRIVYENHEKYMIKRRFCYAFFNMWAELSNRRHAAALQPLKQVDTPSEADFVDVDIQNNTSQASPIIMAGTPPASPIKQNIPQSSNLIVASCILPFQYQKHGECDLDTDSYAAAVLMDHHQSLCNQSTSHVNQARHFRRQPKSICDSPKFAQSSSPHYVGEISGDSDSDSETSSNPHFNTLFAPTLRPLSPTTKAHIRDNIIVASRSNHSSAGLQPDKCSSAVVRETQKIQAFKMVKSPTMAPPRSVSIAPTPQEGSQIEKVRVEISHVGWGCFNGIPTEFSAAASRKHSSFLSNAIALRMRMSEELQSKELTVQKLSARQPNQSSTFECARQPWVRR
jgi:hypothetical protein